MSSGTGPTDESSAIGDWEHDATANQHGATAPPNVNKEKVLTKKRDKTTSSRGVRCNLVNAHQLSNIISTIIHDFDGRSFSIFFLPSTRWQQLGLATA